MNTDPPGYVSGYADVNGTKLYYEMAGAGDPVVLAHGLTLDTRSWDGQFATLAANYRVIRYDARGHGRSIPQPDTPYSFSQDLRGLLDALRIDRSHLVGLSMGGRTIGDFAVDEPGRALSLVFADSALNGAPPVAGFYDRLSAIVTTANNAGVDAAINLFSTDEILIPAMGNPSCARAISEIMADYSGWNWTSGVSEMERPVPTIQMLESITAPALVIVGELDIPDVHAVAGVLEERIPGARKVMMPGVGHVSAMEDPAGFNKLLMEFLAGFG